MRSPSAWTVQRMDRTVGTGYQTTLTRRSKGIHKMAQRDNFPQHTYSIYHRTEFTLEIEKSRQLPFLDLPITKKLNGSFGCTVCRKPTHKIVSRRFKPPAITPPVNSQHTHKQIFSSNIARKYRTRIRDSQKTSKQQRLRTIGHRKTKKKQTYIANRKWNENRSTISTIHKRCSR